MNRLALTAIVVFLMAAAGLAQEVDEVTELEPSEEVVVTEEPDDGRAESALIEGAAGGERGTGPELIGGLEDQWRVYTGPENFRLPVGAVSAFDQSLAPYSRFLSHRGAGARITTFRTGLESLAPLARHPFPPWTFVAGLSLSEYYTDNVFLTADDERSEFTTVMTPQVGVEWSRARFGAAVRYSAQIVRPHRFTENEREDQQLGLQSDWRIKESLTARLENVYGWRTVAADFEGDDFTRFCDNYTTLGLTYNPWSDWEVDFGYSRYQARFDEFTTDNVTSNGFTTGASRRISPAIWAQARYQFSNIDNQDVGGVNSDNDVQTGSVGLRFDPTAFVTGSLHVGYTIKDYDLSEADDQDALYVNSGVVYSPRPWVRLFGTLNRYIRETSTTALNEPSGLNYTRTSTSLGSRFDVTDRLGLGLLSFFSTDDYSGPAGREDDLYGGTVSLFYDVNPRYRIGARYQYQTNDSNDNSRDFDENFVSASLQITF